MLSAKVRATLDSGVEVSVKDGKPMAEVIGERGLIRAMLDQGKMYHLFTKKQLDKYDIFSAMNCMVHEAECDDDKGSCGWWSGALVRTGNDAF